MKTPQTVYVSGPMSGLAENNYPAFHRAAAELRARGYRVVNPAELAITDPESWASCMRSCVRALTDCDCIVMLEGWQASRGAKIELDLARHLDMQIRTMAELQAICESFADEGGAA